MASTRRPAGGGTDNQEDCTALREQIAELTRALALRDEVIATIGHELRNPLSPLFLQLSRLIEEVRGGEVARRGDVWLAGQLEVAMARLDGLLATLDRLLEASRSGGLSLQLEEVDLAHVVSQVVGGMRPAFEAARSELRVEAPAPVLGLWDPVRLQQIVHNLLSNALRYGAGAPVDVRVHLVDDQVSLVVQDRGVGIAPEDLERIFLRYEQATEGSRGGFGLGLWIVRRLCQAMGGNVAVDSRLGEGSSFTVTLPGEGGWEAP